MRTTRLLTATCIALALPLLASAQPPELKIPTFADLDHKAVDSVNLPLGSAILGLASHFVDDHDPNSGEVKKTLAGLKSVQIRSYQFDSDYVYSKADLDSVRVQLEKPGWSRLVQTRDRNKNEAVDVYLALDQHTVTGIAIITSDPRKFTIVNVIGTIDVNQIAQLQKSLAGLGGHEDTIVAHVP